MIDYNVGDRVRTIKGNICCEIIYSTNLGCFVRYLVSGTTLEKWVKYDDIQLDMKYYRDLKIKQILDEI